MPEPPVPETAPPAKPGSARVLLQMLRTYAWFIVSLFLAAGRFDWKRGWIAVALWVVGMTTLGLIAHYCNPGLLRERAKWRRKDTKPFDKVFLAIYAPLVMLQPAFCGLDAVRYHWSSMPFASVYPGVLLFALAMALIGWVLATNPYAESTVRIQTDRGQTVVTSGPYRFVRHPFYVGSILMYMATPLVLGSAWALLTTVLIVLLFVWRTAREDQTLRQELPGYEEFAARTRYRLLPGVW